MSDARGGDRHEDKKLYHDLVKKVIVGAQRRGQLTQTWVKKGFPKTVVRSLLLKHDCDSSREKGKGSRPQGQCIRAMKG